MFHVKHIVIFANIGVVNMFHDKFMSLAIEESKKAYLEGNVPVGAVIVNNGKVLSSFHNTKNTTNVSVYHAEILAIIDSCKKLGSWYLDECVMYVTLKPCYMCMAAIAESRISTVYYLLESNYSDNLLKNLSNINLIKMKNDNDYSKLMTSFFSELR